MDNKTKNLLLIAGEVSGDNHGAALVHALRQQHSSIRIFGIGGDALQDEGMELMYHLRDMAFLGVGEVIKHLPFILGVQRDILERCKRQRPNAALLIDYPGFNLRLARSLHEQGIKVIYYISPQLWAWGRHRVEKIRKYVHKMLVLFPFEKKFYEQFGIDVHYVGHPMVDRYDGFQPPAATSSGHKPNRFIGLLPGSRTQEINSLLPKMLQTARLLRENNKIDRAEVIAVKHISKALYKRHLQSTDDFIQIKQTSLAERLPNFDAVMVASGTATLECGFFRTPMLIVYHVNPLTYWLGRMLVRLDSIGLVNIVAEKEVAPELIQNQFKPRKAAVMLSDMLEPARNQAIREELRIIRDKLGEPGAAKRAAFEVSNTLFENHEQAESDSS